MLTVTFFQANLEMNKETFAAELVCLLEVASLASDVADLKAEIESFFIAGSARIDLIAKVMDLDNDIGGYNFDIPVLQDTENAIAEIGESPGTISVCFDQGKFPSVSLNSNFLVHLP